MEASLASGANGKGKVVEQLGEGPPLSMLPASLATHQAARRLLVNDDAVAAGSAAVLGPLALPALRVPPRCEQHRRASSAMSGKRPLAQPHCWPMYHKGVIVDPDPRRGQVASGEPAIDGL